MPLPAGAIPLAMSVAKSTGAAIAANAATSAVGALVQAVRNGTDISSLADLSRPARVEPLVLVEQTLQNQPYMENVMKFGLTNFTAYYLQAFNMLMNVGRIETLKVFDSLNPNRNYGMGQGALLQGTILSNEHFDNGLPSLEDYDQPVVPGLIGTVSIEDFDGVQGNAKVDKLYEVESLSVGKLVNVELKDGDNTAKIPVLIRLQSTTVKTDIMSHIFTAGGRDSYGERFQLARAGLIRPIRDLIFGIDLLDEHRRALMGDTSGAYKAITDRRRNNVKKAAMSGVVSAADASNIAVITKSTAKLIGQKLYGKLETQAVRNRIFDNSYLLLLIVVDEQYENITVYHRGLDIPGQHTFKEIASAEKGRGQDITEVYKMILGAMGSNV
ncbi:virion structural protein [Pseudomonas phage Noxifer]|uniref:Virion structural protein n=1 Tax=Pseudomonas phage Noxifer TaxID=2006684 RepID=A0A1Y0SV32_9CAUD|nr:virion structural protein [Pseudomonas phage Noxifer]ARV77260.1 virion structural protein [Pseudomonas phage Noxifer]